MGTSVSVFQKERVHILHFKQGTDSVDNGTDGTGTGTKGVETGTKMSKRVVFGVAVILAVVAVAALVAVLVSGKKEDGKRSIASTQPAQPLPEQTAPEVFMQTNNSFHGGVVIKDNNEFQKVVGYEIIGRDAVGENKTLQMDTLAGAIVSGDELELGEPSYKRHMISQERPEDKKIAP